MERERIAMSPPQRALAEGPFMPISSREMREGLLDASPRKMGNTGYRSHYLTGSKMEAASNLTSVQIPRIHSQGGVAPDRC